MTRGWIGAGVAAWIVLSVSLWVSDASPDVVVLAGVVAVAVGGTFAAVGLGRAVATIRWPATGPNPAMPVEPDRRIVRFRRDARNAVRSDSTDLHARLSALVGEHPDGSAATRRLAAGPNRRIGSARELDRILSDLEVQ